MKQYRFLILRRFVQLSILALFFLSSYLALKLSTANLEAPKEGLKSLEKFTILEGDLSSALLFGKIDLTDPYAMLQLFFAGGDLDSKAIIGAFIIFFVYAIFLGRMFCSFVCPMNMVTDSANYLNRKLGINKLKSNLSISRNVRYWIMVIALILSFIFSVAAFEAISPVAMLHREIIFGAGIGMLVIVAIFLFDLFILKNGFCGHICPLGAFYSFTSRFSLLRVKYLDDKCSRCMKCKIVCPERQVLEIVGKDYDGFINSGECTRCGRCIEVCETDALGFSIYNFAQTQKDTKNEKNNI